MAIDNSLPVYVYAPLSGEAVAVDCYCNRRGNCAGQPDCNKIPPCNPPGCTGCDHVIVFGPPSVPAYCCPIDVNSPAGSFVCFVGNDIIESIRVEYVDGLICLSGVVDPINYGIKVHLYRKPDATECYMGTVLYAHLKNRETFVSNGQVINRNGTFPFVQILGQVPDPPVPADGCYQSTHSHMSVLGLDRRNFNCGDQVYGGTTWLFHRTYNDGDCFFDPRPPN